MSEQGYWWESVHGPKDIPRPQERHGGAFFYFKDEVYDLMFVWPHIKQLTESGQLGHYSAFSNDREVIAVHHSDPNDQQQKSRIETELNNLGVQPKWREQADVHGGVADQPSYYLEGEPTQSCRQMVVKRKWSEWVFAPDQMARPANRYEGGFVFFSFEDFNNIEELWPQIKKMTEKNCLGYLSTTDKEIIAVHCSDINQMDGIYNKLNTLGVKNIRLTTEKEALYRDETAFELIDENEANDGSDESDHSMVDDVYD